MKYNLKKYLICCISETNKFTLQKNFYNKIWYTHVYIQIWDYYSAMKTNEILPFVANMDGAGSYYPQQTNAGTENQIPHVLT